jgi:hypothetical protein
MKNISRYFIVLICIFCNINILNSQWVQTICPDSWINSFAVSDANLFAGTWNGVYLSSDNGTSWNAVNSGLTSTDVSCFAIMGKNLFAGTYNNGIYVSTNNGMNWTFSGLTNTWVTAFAVCGNSIFAGTNYNGVFLSTNNGTNWTAVSSAGIKDTLRFPTVSALAVTVNGSGDTSIFAGMSGINVGGVYLLTNNGTNWTEVDSGLTNTQIAALAACGDNIFAGTRSGVFRSTNNGINWTAIDSGLTNNGPIPTIYSLSILPNGKCSTNLFAGTWNGVYQSTNNGTSWNAINSGLPINTPIYALAILPNGKGDTNLFAGTIHGVWQHPFSQWTPTISLNQYSIEFGSPPSTWKQTKTATLKITCGSLAQLIIDSVYTMTKWFVVASVQDTIAEGDTVSLLISFTPDSLSVPQYYDTLFIISNSIYSLIKVPLRGIIEIPISVSQSGSDIPNIFGLSQNYPNPFNPTTIINYQLPVSNFVTLKVYNILGREVEILVNEKKNAGNYSIAFNAAKLSSGVYFYRLQAGSFTETKKLILLR